MCPMIKRPFRLENILLGLLRQGPQHGYSLHLHLSNGDGLGRIWRVKQSQVYAFLEKLEAAGYITSSLDEQDSHLPRRVYALTEAGRCTYLEWVGSPVLHPYQMRQEFLAKLYFALQEGEAISSSLIEGQSQLCRDWGERVIRDLPESQRDFDQILAKYRLAQVQMIQSFLKDLAP
jgi:DNA-binding PadR family transcriptional regulator